MLKTSTFYNNTLCANDRGLLEIQMNCRIIINNK